jgi:hypothetical protein
LRLKRGWRMLDLGLFVSKPQPRTLLGIVENGKKRSWWENRPPSEEDLRAHLEGRRLLGVVPDKAINLDLDHTELRDIRPIVEVLNALQVPSYAGPGNTRGSKIWIFLDSPQEDIVALARGLARLAKLLLPEGHTVEGYPNGEHGLFLPFFGWMNGQPRPLYEVWSREPVSLPFQPRYADPEALRRLVRAVPFLEVALQKRPEGPRHGVAMALCNLAHRAGVLEEARALLGTGAVFERWGLGDSRTLEGWREELARMAEAASSPEYPHKKGIPALKESGLDPTPIANLLGEPVEEWPTPRPLEDLETPLPPWKRGILPPALEDLAESLAGRLLVEPTAPAVAMLAAVSAVLGYRKVVVAPEPDNPGWEEVPVLWVALVGPPGTGKTPIILGATRPLWSIERVLDQENRREKEEYDAALQRWQEAKRGERGEKPKPPTPRRLIVSDITPEKLAAILEANPAVLVHVDELKGLLQSWRREERAAGRAFFMSAYNGTSHVVDRILRGTTHLERPQVAILGGIQPGPWHQVVRGGLGKGEDADGLLQRFTPVVLDPLPLVKEPPPVPEDLHRGYEEVVMRLWEEGVPQKVSPSSEAYHLWREWRFETLQDQRNPELPEAWRGYLSKRMGLTARIAGILSVLWGEGGIISERTMARAIYLVKGILEPHARRAWRVGQVGDLSPALRLGKKLKEGRVERFTRREVYRNEWGGISTSEEAGQALWLLEKAGWVLYDPATKTYRVNPRIREGRGG